MKFFFRHAVPILKKANKIQNHAQLNNWQTFPDGTQPYNNVISKKLRRHGVASTSLQRYMTA